MIKYTGKHWLIIIGIGSLILALYIFFKKTPPDIYWAKDAKQMYAISYNETSEAWSINSNKHSRKVKLRGTLNFRIFEKSSTIKAGLQFSSITLLLNGKSYDSLDKIYTTIFLIEFKKNGEISSFHFNNDTAPEDEKDIAAIIRLLQLIIKKSITAAWNTTETDMLGKYFAEYIYENGTLHKKKLHYLTVLDKQGFPNKNFSSTVRDSTISATYGEPISWVNTTSIHERISIFSGDDSYATSDITLQMKKKKFKPQKNLFIWKHNERFSELINAWENKEKNTISFSNSLRLQEIKFKYGSTSSKSIIQKIISANGTEKEQSISDLVEVISILHGESKNIPQLIAELNLKKDDKEILIKVLAKAGHSTAQKALCRIINDTAFDIHLRNTAVIGLGSVKNLEPLSIDCLWTIYHKYTLRAPSLSGNSILSLAYISQLLSMSNDEEKQEQGEQIREKILSQLKSAKSINHITLLLKAAGKTGHEDAAEEIENYIDNISIPLRIVALSSLKDIDDSKADDLLIERLSDEESISVKKVILGTLLKRKTNEKAIDEIIELIPQEKNRTTRELMYHYIIKGKGYSISKEKLQELQKNEPSAKNKMLIDAIINQHDSIK